MTNINFVVELKSIASGYRVMNYLENLSPVHIYEGALNGEGGFTIIGRSTHSETDRIKEQISKVQEISDFVFYEEGQLKVKEALYGLTPQKIEGYLGVLESTTLSCNIRLLQNLEDVCLVELMNGRGTGGKSVAFFTGNKVEAINSTLESLRSTDVKFLNFSVIDKPGPAFRSQFQFSDGV